MNHVTTFRHFGIFFVDFIFVESILGPSPCSRVYGQKAFLEQRFSLAFYIAKLGTRLDEPIVIDNRSSETICYDAAGSKWQISFGFQ